MDPVIELVDVRRSFDGRLVIDGLGLEVFPGDIVGLVGPNGAGKTTTVRLCTGVLPPTGGTVRVLGLEPAGHGEAVRRATGVLTESAQFYGHLTGFENLVFFARLAGVTDRGRLRALLAQVGLDEAADRRAGTYSTGMRKRLGLARALAHRPRILFLDEPTNGLDPDGIRDVLELLGRLARESGTTMVVCSHLLQQLEVLCTRYVFIEDGRVIAAGTEAELERRFAGGLVLDLETDAAPEALPPGAVHSSPGRWEVPLASRDDVPALVRSVSAQANVFGATLRRPSLEDLYFRIRSEARRAA
jgi:ABC-2 type transport system ATP-binding protein